MAVPMTFVELPWLPPAPADFTRRCRAFGADETSDARALQLLAGYRASSAEAGSLSRALAKRVSSGGQFAPMTPFRLCLLASSTFDILADCIPAAAARHGVITELIMAPYDQVMQQALDPTSDMNRAKADAVLLAVDHRWLQLDRPHLSDDAAAHVATAVDRLEAVVMAIRENGGGTAILQTLPIPPGALFGNLDRRARGTVRWMVEEANHRLVDLADRTGAYLLDVAALAERVGTDLWFDPVQWGAYKLPFASVVAPAYADLLGRLLGAVRGKARKCLVLDLDNTLWGGVIGDDGLEGIKIGQGSALGEAHLAVQHMAIDLRERGVILAVSSKNDDHVARLPFQKHPDMALREEHISVFQANWLDKASNLEAIARALNIGVDSLVFLDDNPAERAQLRAALPAVAIPELPNEPSLFPSYLLAAGYFESLTFTTEDRIRVGSYASDAQRAAVMASTRDLGDYLSSLAMKMRATQFDAQGRQRIAQLIGKSNQFNLTTRRHTQEDVARFEADPNVYTLQARLEDKFGDLGMIGVVICVPVVGALGDWNIDTWLMSCRVLGRKVEEAMLAEVAGAAKARGARRLIGVYIPTSKNAMVADHYGKLGFELVAEVDGHRTFVLDLASYRPPDVPIEVLREAPGDLAPLSATAAVGA